MIRSSFLLVLFFLASQPVSSQQRLSNPVVRFNLNDSATHYLQFNGMAQIWLRHTQMDPGTTIFGSPSDSYSDISLRRLRLSVYGQLTDQVSVFLLFGQNNFNYHSEKFAGAFFHDALVEYKIIGNKLSAGGGLTAWGGPTRYASPAIGTIMSVDAPLYQQATNGVNDQFLRKLSLYIKGQLGRLDYRLAIAQPFNVEGAPFVTSEPASPWFTFSNEIPEKQFLGYVKYMFLDAEDNRTPYHAGTYLGEKSIFNIGAGFVHQANALWALNPDGTISRESMTLIGADVFLDKPVATNANLTAYASVTSTSYGSGFIRYVGVNNAATGGTAETPGNYGNGFPMHGNGTVSYFQLGYLFGRDILLRNGKLLPFIAVQYGDYDRLSKAMILYETGFSYLFQGTHRTKLGIMYQNRPVYAETTDALRFDGRRGMTVIQLQAGF